VHALSDATHKGEWPSTQVPLDDLLSRRHTLLDALVLFFFIAACD
jgi:hypothetical protein